MPTDATYWYDRAAGVIDGAWLRSAVKNSLPLTEVDGIMPASKSNR